MKVFGKLSTTKQGNIGVARAIFEYTSHGYTVFLPTSESEKYDLIIDDGIKLNRVQVKTSRNKNKHGGYVVKLSRNHINKTKNIQKVRKLGDYDILFVLTQDGTCYSIPDNCIGDIGFAIVVGNEKYREFKISASLV